MATGNYVPPPDGYTGETVGQYITRRIAALRQDRNSFESHWRDLSTYILPRAARFFIGDKNQKGNARNTKIINNTGIFALRTLSSGMMSGITSPSRPWFQLRTELGTTSKNQEVKVWLDTVRQRMAEVFLRSNLYTTLPVVYEDLGCFGTSAFAVMEDEEDTLRCYHFPIGSYTLSTSKRGTVNGCYREFQMSVAQVVADFGYENCSSDVQSDFREKKLDRNVDVIHAIEDNPDVDLSKMESKFLPVRSVYFEKAKCSENKYLRFKGMHEFPVMAPRWRVVGEDTWGLSPAMDVLGDVMQLQLEEKRKLQALEMLVNPPRSAPASIRNDYVGTLAGEITFVPDAGIGAKVEPNYVINPYLNHLSADIQTVENRIRKGLYEDLFLLVADIERSGVTATEIQARLQEKMMSLGPVMERLNDEMLDPLVKRAFGIMMRSGQIPPPPEELQNTEVSIEYISTMAQAMKLQGVVSVERMVGFIGSMAATRPDVLDKLNTDSTIDVYADMVGVPPSIINSEEVVNATRQQRAQQEQQAQMMAMAQQSAQTAQTMADTQVSTPSMLSAMAGTIQGMAQ